MKRQTAKITASDRAEIKIAVKEIPKALKKMASMRKKIAASIAEDKKECVDLKKNVEELVALMSCIEDKKDMLSSLKAINEGKEVIKEIEGALSMGAHVVEVLDNVMDLSKKATVLFDKFSKCKTDKEEVEVFSQIRKLEEQGEALMKKYPEVGEFLNKK